MLETKNPQLTEVKVRLLGAEYLDLTAKNWQSCNYARGVLDGLPEEIGAYRLKFELRFPEGAEIRVHHQALPRLHRCMSLPVEQTLGAEGLFRTRWTGPGNFDRFCGHQDLMLHNALVVFQEPGSWWLCAPLSETLSKIGYAWKRRSSTVCEVTVEARFPGLRGRATQKGCYDAEPIFQEAGSSFGPEVFAGYHRKLRQRSPGRMQSGPLSRNELVWGSWNEGIFRDISHDMIIEEARFLAEKLPEVKWIQIDDGYHANAAARPGEHSARFGTSDLGVHACDERAWCRRRFPKGMRALADEIRGLGLRPMIWFSPSCHINSPLVSEHPEWFRKERLHYVPEFALPDFSLPAVRDCVSRALDRLFVDWGFEGVKLDFWSYGFLSYDPHFARQDACAQEWVRWMGQEIRDRIGEDGLMLSCLEAACGDPLMGDLWDMHRTGPDLCPHRFSLDTLEEIAVWVAATHGLKQCQQHSWMSDSDGLSLYRHEESEDPELRARNDARWRLVVAFMVASGSAVELAGRLSKQVVDSRFAAFKRAVESIRLGQALICPGYDWVRNEGRAPLVWWTQASDGCDVLGLTNWTETPVTLTVPETLWGRSALDVFAGGTLDLPGQWKLGPGDGALFSLHA